MRASPKPNINPRLLTPRQEFTDPSMWGYHVRAEDFPYDNRPEAPLQQYTFKQWWFVSAHHFIKANLNQFPRSARSLGPCSRRG